MNLLTILFAISRLLFEPPARAALNLLLVQPPPSHLQSRPAPFKYSNARIQSCPTSTIYAPEHAFLYARDCFSRSASLSNRSLLGRMRLRGIYDCNEKTPRALLFYGEWSAPLRFFVANANREQCLPCGSITGYRRRRLPSFFSRPGDYTETLIGALTSA